MICLPLLGTLGIIAGSEELGACNSMLFGFTTWFGHPCSRGCLRSNGETEAQGKDSHCWELEATVISTGWQWTLGMSCAEPSPHLTVALSL